jgi:type II secretory pathway predicted ATPase ExeA
VSALYLEHFGLTETPFSITPNPHFFWAGSGRGSLLQALRYAVQSEEGIVTVIGEVGSGKTMLCRMLLEDLPDGIDAIYLANPSFSRNEILDAIAHDLGVDTGTAPSRVDALNAELIRRFAAGRRVVLLIDEAHAMPRDSLEEVRLLSNLETSTQKLLNIVLFGQPELNELLAQRDLRQLRERVVQRFELGPLPPGELRDYLAFRLQTAGFRGALPFSDAALALIARAASGITRRIHILADKALLSAFARNVPRAEAEDVRRACRDAGIALPARWRSGWRAAAIAAALLLAFLGGHFSSLPAGRGQPAALDSPGSGAASAASTGASAAIASAANRGSVVPAHAAAAAPATAPEIAVAAPAPAPPAAQAPEQPIAAEPLAAAERRLARWLAAEGVGYTLQIATLAGRDRAALQRQLGALSAELGGALPMAAQQLQQGSPTLVVYLGDHPDATSASAAALELPAVVRNNQPIVRSRATLRSGDRIR